MNNLTSSLLVKNYNYQVEEYTKQGDAVQFDSGKEQRLVKYSIPSIEISISYAGLNFSDYEAIRIAYESNHSNTFICLFEDPSEISYYVASDYYVSGYVDTEISRIDMRAELMGSNSAVWAFKEFKFTIDASTRLYKGSISLVTSVFFNFTQYQDLFSQTSSYSISPSTDETFTDILDEVPPYQAELGYSNNAMFSNIGESVRHAKNKGGLKRVWNLKWIINESQFIQLLTFYRKKSGIMGEFGFPDYGTNAGVTSTYLEFGYIENQNDYIQLLGIDNLSNARFSKDSFQYQKRVDGMYTCEADFVEVKI